MKNKIIYSINYLWASIIAFSAPVCIGIIYQCITGHSKGYGYDLGDEKIISIMFGCIMLVIWLVLAIPSNIYVFKKTIEKGFNYIMIPVISFVILFILCIYLIGGLHEFGRFFHF